MPRPRRGNQAGAGRGRNQGTNMCVCPKCGHEVTHRRGIPCSETKCPKCETPMRGAYCR